MSDAVAALRPDLRAIFDLIAPDTRVLDVGCGDGALLAALRDAKGCDARGVEIDPAEVARAMARGLAVVQGDADRDLGDWPGGLVDWAILSDTLQAMRAPDRVLGELLRIGARAVVSFPNFGHWRARAALGIGGRMPVTRALPASWFATANLHLCTVADFRDTAAERGLVIERELFFSGGRRVGAWTANLRAEAAVFVLRAGASTGPA